MRSTAKLFSAGNRQGSRVSRYFSLRKLHEVCDSVSSTGPKLSPEPSFDPRRAPWNATMKLHLTLLLAALSLGTFATPASAQWNPSAGEWGKSNPRHLRVMTWNVRDNVRTAELKTEGLNAWTAIATVIASLQPDVLVLQETGDNGCGGCVDTTAELRQVLELLMYGGADPWVGGQATAYVQKYAPNYDLPYRHVSGRTDGFNRNVLLSRFPFTDLNGDGKGNYSNEFASVPDAYAPGTAGSNQIIRGFQFAEIDLPDRFYLGYIVVGHAHLKSGSDSSSKLQRLNAGKNIAYLIDYWYGGAGTNTPDPNGRIFESPAATNILSPYTPVVVGGDWNEDENTNFRKGPAEWITRAATTGGVDGTDRDRTDSTFDAATDPCDDQRATIGSSSKLDYWAWQDSIASEVRSFVFRSDKIATDCGSNFPPELLNFLQPHQATVFASDHRPVVLDLALREKSPLDRRIVPVKQP